MKVNRLVILVVPLESEWKQRCGETYSSAHALKLKYQTDLVYELSDHGAVATDINTFFAEQHIKKDPNALQFVTSGYTNAAAGLHAAARLFAWATEKQHPLLRAITGWSLIDGKQHATTYAGGTVDLGDEADVGVIVVAHGMAGQVLVLDSVIANVNGGMRLPAAYWAPVLVQALRELGLTRVRKLLIHACTGSGGVPRLAPYLLAAFGEHAPQHIASWAHYTSAGPDGHKLVITGDPSDAYLVFTRSLADHGQQFLTGVAALSRDTLADWLEWIDWGAYPQLMRKADRLNFIEQKLKPLHDRWDHPSFLVDPLVAPNILSHRALEKSAWRKVHGGYRPVPLTRWHDDD